MPPKSKVVNRRTNKLYLAPSNKPVFVSNRTRKRWRQMIAKQTKKVVEHDSASTDAIEPIGKTCTDDQYGLGMQNNAEENLGNCYDAEDESPSTEVNLLTAPCGSIVNFPNTDTDAPDVGSDDSTSEGSTNDNDDMDSSVQSDNSHTEDLLVGFERSPDQARSSLMMFPAAALTVSDVMLMANAYSVRNNLTRKEQDDLVQFAKVLAGPGFETWNCSHYMRSKTYDPPRDKIIKHYYCPKCCVIIFKQALTATVTGMSVKCVQCEEQYELSSESPNSFMTIDIKYQIQLLLNEQSIQEDLLRNMKDLERRQDDGVIRDVYDSKLYRKIQAYIPRTLTIVVSTDGAPLFNSSNRSFWPLQLYINELSPKIRFKHIILAGLWLTDKEPKPNFMNLYMSEFCKQLKELMDQGVNIIHKTTGEIMNFKFYCNLVCVDSVARPVIQNRLQFNGYCGCSWCYIHGKHDGSAMRYPISLDDPEFRTHELYKQDATDATRLGKPIKGVKGSSTFLEELSYFDCVWGFPIDYMHGVLLGVVRQLWKTWTTPGTDFYLSPSDRASIDKRFMSIQPSHEIHRLPRTMKEVAKRKSSEWRSWVLFFSAPCLYGILDAQCFESYLLLIRSVFTLLTMEITEDDLDRCEHDLLQFVGECEMFYGTSAMTFNMHSLLHLVESVRQSGPLWATSAFAFENAIFHFKQNVNAAKGVSHQIAVKWLQRSVMRLRIEMSSNAPSSKSYCEKLFNERLLTNFTKSNEGVMLIGTGDRNQKIENILKKFVDGETESARVFNRCVYKGTVFHSIAYTRPKRTDDTMVLLDSQKIMQIHHFVSINDQCYVYGYEILTSASTFASNVNIKHILEVSNNKGAEMMVDAKSMEAKVLHINIGEMEYVSMFPNIVEIQ